MGSFGYSCGVLPFFRLQKFLMSTISHSCFIKLLGEPPSNNKNLILSSDHLNSKGHGRLKF